MQDWLNMQAWRRHGTAPGNMNASGGCNAGVTGVKVDCQAGVGLMGSAGGGGPALAARYQSALENSVAAHFPDNSCINCMCHSTENLYRYATSIRTPRQESDSFGVVVMQMRCLPPIQPIMLATVFDCKYLFLHHYKHAALPTFPRGSAIPCNTLVCNL